MKLYNAGSFFDPRAVPEDDYDAVAADLAGLSRVIVESHPVACRRADEPGSSTRCSVIRRRHGAAALEVAMGLETAHPDALERLHKRMTVDGFLRAADRLESLGVALRVFLLVSPPFVPDAEQDEWLLRSIDVALWPPARRSSRSSRRGPETVRSKRWPRKDRFRPPRLARSRAQPRARARLA